MVIYTGHSSSKHTDARVSKDSATVEGKTTIINRIENHFKGIIVRDFVATMKKLNSDKDSVKLIFSNYFKHVSDLDQPGVNGLLASSIKCKFFGGPPKRQTVYQGSLLTMLVDRVLYCKFN